MSQVAPPFLARVRADGRITIPKTLRELLKLKEGDIIVIEVIQVERGGKNA